jgi:adenine-specific DNA-methyltransferase
MSQNYEKMKTLLKELFQLDQPDLDFGLYRIMHAKSAEVSQFLDKDLLPQVKEAFAQYQTADKTEIEKELAKVIAGIEAAGMDPVQSPKVKELRDRLANDAVDVGALESEVYDHLFSFFRRYYSEGDFLAKRVYKPGVYAIPYEGEEVTLYWANKDQYYIKTSEYLRDYVFRLRPDNAKNPLRAHFRLVDAAEGEHDNVKATEGKDRVFILASPGETGRDFIAEQDGEQGKELVIRFEYRPATLADWPDEVRDGKSKPPAQKDLIGIAVKRVLTVTSLPAWITELGKPHIIAEGEQAGYTRLEMHLKRYTARNTFDYFIHKDLGGFLRRELDFYIKNEVMHLDDVENETTPRVEQYLSKIKVLRKIAGKIIDFLAQLEDFQKKMWLKKKFVVETQYCITLGCIPEEFYAEISANEAQQDEWIKLFAIDEIKSDLMMPGYSNPIKPEFLKANPTLVVDTKHFNVDFTSRLLDEMGDVDEKTDGLLVHSENFQALGLLAHHYERQVDFIYIDPPYNTAAAPILYKNDYKESSWLALIENRLSLAQRMQASGSALCVAIDDTELDHLGLLLKQIYTRHDIFRVIVNHYPGSGTGRSNVSRTHEYGLFVVESDVDLLRGEAAETGERERNYRRSGTGDNNYRTGRPNSFYAVVVEPKTRRIMGVEPPPSGSEYPRGETAEGYVRVYPIGEDGAERVWTLSYEAAGDAIRSGLLRCTDRMVINRLYNDEERRNLLPSVWIDTRFSAVSHGTNLLKNLFGSNDKFTYPKSLHTVDYAIEAATFGKLSATVLDYYAGSGTTGHAVIYRNRADGGNRKFILIEVGDHFNDVILPRIKKVSFTPEWNDGKPERLATPEEAERSPRIVKVVHLESYEDTLNNLETHRPNAQQLLLNAADAQGAGGLKEQFLLRYMLNVDMRGSQSLLNVQAFTDPTAYKLKVKRPGSDENREVNVDLLETFNWLIGLAVQHIAAPQSFSAEFERDSEKRMRLKGRLKQEEEGLYWFRTVTGSTPDGRKTLIIWRKLTGSPEQDNLVLDEWFTKQGYSAKDSEFDIIYVNGSNNLENLKTPDDTWKVRLIEEDFLRLMFEMDGS